MERAIPEGVWAAVASWLRWVPRWEPGTHRGRTKPCPLCLGNPMLAAAGLSADVPHAVAHALATRLKRISDRTVEEYTSRNLPLLESELRGSSLPSTPGSAEQSDPEHEGLELDPEPEPGVPFLFTFAELREPTLPAINRPPLSDAAKQALRAELRLADECGRHTTGLIALALAEHRDVIQAALATHVEPQIDALLAELAEELNSPPSTWS